MCLDFCLGASQNGVEIPVRDQIAVREKSGNDHALVLLESEGDVLLRELGRLSIFLGIGPEPIVRETQRVAFVLVRNGNGGKFGMILVDLMGDEEEVVLMDVDGVWNVWRGVFGQVFLVLDFKRPN